MVRPRRHDDHEILEVARAVFLEHGPGASLQLVAEQVGMSQPALFKRFGTKEAFLVRALAPSERLPWVERLFAGPDQRPLPEQLREIAEGAMAFFSIAVPCMMTLRASGLDLHRLIPSDHPTSPPRVRGALVSFLAAARDRGLLRQVDPERLATLFIGGLQARAMEAHMLGLPTGPDEDAAHAAAVVDLLWSGARPQGAQPAA